MVSRLLSPNTPNLSIHNHHARRLKRASRAAGVITVITAFVLILADFWLPAIGRWLAMPDTAGHADAIVVHGGNLARTQEGAALYHRGLAPELWHTGYARGEQRITAAALRAGVPANSFRYLVTTSTWSDGTQIAAAVRERNLHSILIVTDWWHSRRALCADRQQLQGTGIAVVYTPAPAIVGPDSWWRDPDMCRRVLSELVKLGYYAVRYGMMPWEC